MTRVFEVTTWNDPDEIGDRVVRYTDVRCPECGRMFWCLLWEDTGWPSVHCDACDIEYSYPFDEIDGLEERYSNGQWPAGEPGENCTDTISE